MEKDARAQDKEGERKREVRRSRMVEEYNDEEYDAEFDAMMVTNKSLFRCPECGRSFKKPKHLQVHLVSHERERNIAHNEQLVEYRKADEQAEQARRSAAMAAQEHIRLMEMQARKQEEKKWRAAQEREATVGGVCQCGRTTRARARQQHVP